MQTGPIVLVILLNQHRTIFNNKEFYLFKEPCFDTKCVYILTHSLSLSLAHTHQYTNDIFNKSTGVFVV